MTDDYQHCDFTIRVAELTLDSGDRSLRVVYEVLEPIDAADSIVLLHGSGPGANARSSFNLNVPMLLAARFRLIRIDQPGWGDSDSVVVCERRSFFNANAIAAVIAAECGSEAIHLMGCSMGAHSAVALALERPDAVRSLCLVAGGTGTAHTNDCEPPPGVRLLQGFYREPTRANMSALLRTIVYDASDITEEVVDARLRSALWRPEHLCAYARSIELNPHQYPDVTARLAEIQAPTLVVWGREDSFVPVEVGLRLWQGLPRAEFHAFSKCGHTPHVEYAERFNELALAFLQRQR